MAESPTGGLAIALLAAGQSSRFGPENKLAAPLGDRALIAWSAETGKAIPAAHRYLVTTADMAPAGYDVLINHDAAEGIAASLRLAARAAREAGASALLVLLADMPFVAPSHLARMISVFGAEPNRPVFSQAPDGIPQPPALFPAAYLERLATLSGDSGARQFARDATIIEATEEMLIDVDTPSDLKRAREMLEARKR